MLVSVMDILNQLITILDRMTGSMDGDTADAAMANMQKTIEDMVRLPETEQLRQAAFVEMSSLCKSANGHVDDIRETIRYLKTFAVTVKITGAGIAEFSSFAEEIRERIHFGGTEVGKFAQYLDLMDKQLARARDVSSVIGADFEATIPGIVGGLKTNSGRIGEQHRAMTAMAAKVKSVAQGVQGKIAATLSSLQIGDITRQRVEHVQTTLALFSDYLNSEEALALNSAEMDALMTPFSRWSAPRSTRWQPPSSRIAARFCRHLKFRRRCRNHSFTARHLGGRCCHDGGSALQLLEKDIAKACDLAGRVQEGMADANAVVASVTGTAQDLLHGIEVLRSIKTEIHYMALNSNLRCSKLGDEGRSVNVVSGELRVFADKLESPADLIVADLHRIESVITNLKKAENRSAGDLREPLNEALEAISHAKGQMETGLQDLATEGQAVFSRISAAVIKLDFESELGDVLKECHHVASGLAAGGAGDISGFAEKIQPFSARIYKIYTMAQERDVHLRYLPVDLAPGQKAPATVEDDDDLFADALF